METTSPAGQITEAQEAVELGLPVATHVGVVKVLGDAGVLKGKHFAMLGAMKGVVPGGVWDGDGVVQDGKIITSGICPYLKREMGKADHAAELIQKLVAELGSTQ